MPQITFVLSDGKFIQYISMRFANTLVVLANLIFALYLHIICPTSQAFSSHVQYGLQAQPHYASARVCKDHPMHWALFSQLSRPGFIQLRVLIRQFATWLRRHALRYILSRLDATKLMDSAAPAQTKKEPGPCVCPPPPPPSTHPPTHPPTQRRMIGTIAQMFSGTRGYAGRTKWSTLRTKTLSAGVEGSDFPMEWASWAWTATPTFAKASKNNSAGHASPLQ